MSTTLYPGALDNGSSMPNPGSGDLVASVDHANQHDVINDAAKAIEAKVGIGASTPTASTLLRGTGTGTSAFAQAVLTTDVTGTLPVANGGSGVTSKTGTGNLVLSNSPTLSAPVFTSIVNTGTLTLPTSSDTLVGRATTDTLTNKTMDGGSNTFTNIPVGGIATTSGAWSSWVPTFVNLTGGTLNYAKYTQVGKTVQFRIKYTLGSAGITGAVTFTTPTTMNSDLTAITETILSTVLLTDTGVAQFVGSLSWGSSTTLSVSAQLVNATYNTNIGLSSTIPHTWKSTDVISIWGSYESA